MVVGVPSLFCHCEKPLHSEHSRQSLACSYSYYFLHVKLTLFELVCSTGCINVTM
jgi:hypothetical protein